MEIIDQDEESITLKIKKKDVVLIKNVFREVCCGAYALDTVEFDTLLGSDQKYTDDLLFEFQKIMDDNSIVE